MMKVTSAKKNGCGTPVSRKPTSATLDCTPAVASEENSTASETVRNSWSSS